MTFITQTDRIYISSGSGANAVVKYDTYEPHPIVYSRVNGTINVSNTVSSYTFSIPSREGSGSETRYSASGIDSLTTIYTAPAGVTVDFCISSVRLTSSNAAGTPNTYNYWRMPTNRWYAANGSLLVDQAVQSNGKLERASQITIYTSGNQAFFRFQRSQYSDDASNVHSYTFEYNVLVCKVKET
jgi:hypothetical protein